MGITLTTAGTSALAAAQEQGLKFLVTSVAFGTGQYEPDASATALSAQVAEVTEIAGKLTGDNMVSVTSVDRSESAYTACECGLFGQLVSADDHTSAQGDTVLLAVQSSAEGTALVTKSAVSLSVFSIDVLVNENSDVIVFADESFVIPYATTSTAGVVMLATADEVTAGTNGTKAVTPLAMSARFAALDIASGSDLILKYSVTDTYQKGQLVYSVSGNMLRIYISLIDSNTGNYLTDTGFWSLLEVTGSVESVTAESVTLEATYLDVDFTEGTFVGQVLLNIDGESTIFAANGTVDADGAFSGTVSHDPWTGTIEGTMDGDGNVTSGTLVIQNSTQTVTIDLTQDYVATYTEEETLTLAYVSHSVADGVLTVNLTDSEGTSYTFTSSAETADDVGTFANAVDSPSGWTGTISGTITDSVWTDGTLSATTGTETVTFYMNGGNAGEGTLVRQATKGATYSGMTSVTADGTTGVASTTITLTTESGETIELVATGTVNSENYFSGTVADGTWTGTVQGTLGDDGLLTEGTVSASNGSGGTIEVTIADGIGSGTIQLTADFEIANITEQLSQASAALDALTYAGTAGEELSIGTAGEAGFGVGFTEALSDLSQLDIAPCPGYRDPESPTYGNYLHRLNGQLVCIPRFYVRYGYEGSPHYATWGVNSIDVCSVAGYEALSAAEQATGWFVPRAFTDGGAVKDFFMFSKYMCAYSSTYSALTSARGLDGTASLSSGVYNMIDYGRTVEGFAAPTVFMVAALRMLTLAHAQAGTSAQNCAWHDSTFAECLPHMYSIDSAFTANTKQHEGHVMLSSHNGQASGVSGIGNYVLWATGLTTAGTSESDTALTAGADVFLLAEAKSFLDLTSGFGGTTDHFGTAENLSSGMFGEGVSLPFTTYSSSTIRYWHTSSPLTERLFTDPTADEASKALFCVCPASDAVLAEAMGTDASLTGYGYCTMGLANNMLPLVWGGTASNNSVRCSLQCHRAYSHSYADLRAATYGGI